MKGVEKMANKGLSSEEILNILSDLEGELKAGQPDTTRMNKSTLVDVAVAFTKPNMLSVKADNLPKDERVEVRDQSFQYKPKDVSFAQSVLDKMKDPRAQELWLKEESLDKKLTERLWERNASYSTNARVPDGTYVMELSNNVIVASYKIEPKPQKLPFWVRVRQFFARSR
jgi:hypothetical protein